MNTRRDVRASPLNNGNDCDDEIKKYRRNAARDLNGFHEWTAGDRGDDDWTDIAPCGLDRTPIFGDLDGQLTDGGHTSLPSPTLVGYIFPVSLSVLSVGASQEQRGQWVSLYLCLEQ